MPLCLCNFTTLSKAQKEMILQWRNHERIRTYMFRQTPILGQEHTDFIEKLKGSLDRRYFLVQYESSDIGVIDFTHISSHSATIGLYVNPYLNQKGLGSLLMSAILGYAKETLNLPLLYAEAFATNTKAIHLYQKFGFFKVEEKEVNNQHIICMERIDENRSF